MAKKAATGNQIQAYRPKPHKLHNRILKIRKEKGYNVDELARRFALARGSEFEESDLWTVRAAEAGEEPTLLDVFLIAEALDTKVGDIFWVT